eukprot:NODE_999_length_1178_cov_250.157662_g759_i0.p1 GENE.NODE_999_length_1178_cov_250.157662_g759_i0~~NODE_999_length_1178_cov_250.157662_g759_i0.p1  ORF type:complete len:348 (-),score=91.15 NODE_999_length_1178_cov_250.157662_g759_i0:133-1107(-)
MSKFFSPILQKVDACSIEVHFNPKAEDDPRKTITIEDSYSSASEQKEELALYDAEEPVNCKVFIKPTKKITHQGIKVELIGQIVIVNDREEKSEFTNQTKKFAEPGEIRDQLTLDCNFDCPKQFESYRGCNARVGYFVKVTIIKSVKNTSHRQEFWVHRIDPTRKPTSDNMAKKSYFKEKDFSKGVSMEVGVDDILHIEFKYDKKLFHLKERVLGQVNFKVVSLDLQFGEVSIVKREYIGVGDAQFFDAETLQKYEIMDGTPIAGEQVPIRLYLNSVPKLTPTYDLVNNTFSVKYYVNLVLITGDGKRYFKQQEIVIYRKPDQL